MGETEFLYHYTSLESLALILKNRTIRLNPLDKMDDLQERKAADIKDIGKYVFVSSWTDDPTESIPMWKMYTDSTSGVRIKLRKNPFIWRDIYVGDLARETGMPFRPFPNSDGRIHTFIDLVRMVKNGFCAVEGLSGEVLQKVTYTDDISLLEPRVFRQDSKGKTLSLGLLGLHKSTYWSFQREWRYRMLIVPMKYLVDSGEMGKEAAYIMQQIVQGVGRVPFRHYDINISPEAFAEMEITCSPQMTSGNRLILEALAEKYNSEAAIRESKLWGKI